MAGVGQDVLGCGDTVRAGHVDVHQDHVGAGLGGENDGLVTVGGLADNR
jgi:hypothetical protein